MVSFRVAVLVLAALGALLGGVFFALPLYHQEYASVEINGASFLMEVASSPAGRVRGLAGRRTISPRGGMLFLFDGAAPHTMWMKGMEFPIDIFWIRQGRVVDLEEYIPPPAISTPDYLLPVYQPETSAELVLETAAGFAARHRIRIGDEVKVFFKDGRVVQAAQGRDNTPGIGENNDTERVPPGSQYFIETLRGTPSRGGDFRIEKILATTGAYYKYQILYRSGDLVISGVMNVPRLEIPEGGLPVLILNHGLIDPGIYTTGRGSRREQDFFTRHGYITIHSDYRGHASSSPNPEAQHDFYAGYTEDVTNLIDAVKEAKPDFIDLKRIGMWGHSMGGGMAARVAVLRQDIRAYVLFAPISADAEDNFYELSPEEIGWLAETYGVGSEARKIYDKISPLTYFADVQAPVQLHHGTDDTDVPLSFSEKMFMTLEKFDKKVEFFQYPGQKHEFIEDWPLAAERALQFFDRYVKEAR